MDNSKITIDVRGETASGKTTLAVAIAELLEDHGINHRLELLDGAGSYTKEDLDKRMRVLSSRDTEVTITETPTGSNHSVKPKTGMTFGEALEALKVGQLVTRRCWNGKDMFLFLLPAGSIPKSAIHDPTLRKIVDENCEGDTFPALPSIRMWTADKKVLTGWLASQMDMLSDDWELVD